MEGKSQLSENNEQLCYNKDGKINALGIVPAARKVVFLTTFPSNIN
jgi:hypothetical protein